MKIFRGIGGVSGRLLLAFVMPTAFAAGDGGYELDLRANIVGSSGKPTNDVLGFGVGLHRRLGDDWYIGFNFEHSPQFDFETPSKIVGLRGSAEVDAVGVHSLFTLVGERRYALAADGWSGFWNFGAGFNLVDINDAEGGVVGGGNYDIETDADTEFVLVGSLGWIQRLGDNWSARYAIAAEHHSGGWEVRDRISGNSGEIEDYAIYGLRLGVTYRF